jgi:hypothetical protein
MSPNPSVSPQAGLEYDSGDESAVRVRVREAYKPRRDVMTRVRHDLRSLVHAVSGYSDLLGSSTYGPLSPEQQRFLAHLRQAADQLEDVTEACIELAGPDNDQGTLELPIVSLAGALDHVERGLRAERITCALEVPAELRAYELALDVPQLTRALKSLGSAMARSGSDPFPVAVVRVAGQVVVRLGQRAAPEAALVEVESLTDELGNRDFVRLKLAEVLLRRQEIALRVSATLDFAELTFA